jgi:hypothetical protein
VRAIDAVLGPPHVDAGGHDAQDFPRWLRALFAVFLILFFFNATMLFSARLGSY